MEELEISLARQRTEPGSVRVLPVWYGITYQQCYNLEAVYNSEEWIGGEVKPAPNVLARWAMAVRELLELSAIRDDQVTDSASCRNARCNFMALLRVLYVALGADQL